MHRMRTPILLFSTLLLLAGCPSEPSAAPESAASQVSAAQAARFHGTDISQDPIGGDFTLTSHNGRSVSLSDFRGKVVVLVFGYTHCPDVCPTHLLTYAQAIAQLPPKQAEAVQLLFVSVDPARDRPELLARYVPAFNPSFIGLTSADGGEAETQTVMKLYGATAVKQPPQPNGFYSVDHSSATFLINRQGRPVVMEAFGQTATQLAEDLKTLLNQQP